MFTKRIQSKTSVKSSSGSSGKSANQSEDVVARMQAEVATLKQTIHLLKVTVEKRDTAIEKLEREKEKLNIELKSAQRTNRNLHQQLIDERDMHSKENEYLNNEIRRLTQKEQEDFLIISKENDRDPNISLEEEIKAKDQVIYNIGEKYLKMKSNKKYLQKKLRELEYQSKKTCEDILILLKENRCSLNSMLQTLIKVSSMSPSTKKYIELLKTNALLHFENTQLKVGFAHIGLLQKIVGEKSGLVKHNQIDGVALSTEEKPGKGHRKVQKHRKKNNSRYETNSLAILKHRFEGGADKLINPVSCRHFQFQRVHNEFSPYYRRHLRRSKSDSYLLTNHDHQ